MLLFLSAQVLPVGAETVRDSLHFTMERYPGYFGEYCLEMRAGDTLEVVIRSPHPVRVNLHYHEDTDEARYLLDDVKDDQQPSSVGVDADGEYCIQVTNFEGRQSRFELTLDYEVSRTD